MNVLQAALRPLSAVAPGLAATIAGRFWFTPPHMRLDDAARAFLAGGERVELSVNGRPVVGWSFGSGPAVALMHGWGGAGAQMQPFVPPLTAAGYRAILFDAPGHGASGGSRLGARRSTLIDFADALEAVSDFAGPLHGLVAHSGGCTAAAWAIARSWTAPPLVFVAPMGSLARYRDLFQAQLGLSDAAMHRFVQSAERSVGFRFADMEVPAIAARAATPPVLVIHDRDDRETTWEEGAAIASEWPNAELVTTEGLGHRRILRDRAVVDAAVRFLGSALSFQAAR